MINTGLGGKEKACFPAFGPEWSTLTGLRKRSQPRWQQPRHCQGCGRPGLWRPHTPGCGNNWAHSGSKPGDKGKPRSVCLQNLYFF